MLCGVMGLNFLCDHLRSSLSGNVIFLWVGVAVYELSVAAIAGGACIKVWAGLGSLQRPQGRSSLCLFQFLVAASVPGLAATSLQSVRLRPHCLLLCDSQCKTFLYLPHRDTCDCI